jgi:hypothetical protein
MGNIWSSVDPAMPAKDPLASPVVDIMHELAVDRQSLMNPRTNRAAICGDIINCIRRYVDAPRLIALTKPLITREHFGPKLPRAANAAYGLSVFDMGADSDAQKWTHHAFEYDQPTPLRCDITPYAPHTIAFFKGGVFHGVSEKKERYTHHHPFKHHASDSFLWSCKTNTSISTIPLMPTPRADMNAITLGDSLILYGFSGDNPNCDILRDSTWATTSIAKLPMIINQSSAKLPLHSSVLIFAESTSTWMLDFNQFAAFERGNHTYSRHAIRKISATTLGADTIYICQPARTGFPWYLGPGDIKRYDIRLDKFEPLAKMPIQFAAEYVQSSVALDEVHIALLGTTIHQPEPKQQLQPDCWIYDTRANAWWQEPRWAIGHNILTTLKM